MTTDEEIKPENEAVETPVMKKYKCLKCGNTFRSDISPAVCGICGSTVLNGKNY